MLSWVDTRGAKKSENTKETYKLSEENIDGKDFFIHSSLTIFTAQFLHWCDLWTTTTTKNIEFLFIFVKCVNSSVLQKQSEVDKERVRERVLERREAKCKEYKKKQNLAAIILKSFFVQMTLVARYAAPYIHNQWDGMHTFLVFSSHVMRWIEK